MNELLQQASHALCVHDADALERLAAEAGRCSMPADPAAIRASLEVLQLQVAAAARHLELQRRLGEPSGTLERSWAR